MKFTISGKNIELTEGIKNAIETKFSKLSKYFDFEIKCKAVLSVEKDRQKIEVTLLTNSNIIRTEQSSQDMYISIDLACSVLEKQILKYRHKIIDKKRSQNIPVTHETEDIIIEKHKIYQTSPMSPEDACILMELSEHDFYIFLNNETNKINVVYKRKNDTYGLIEPEN